MATINVRWVLCRSTYIEGPVRHKDSHRTFLTFPGKKKCFCCISCLPCCRAACVSPWLCTQFFFHDAATPLAVEKNEKCICTSRELFSIMCAQPRQRSRSSGPVILLHDLGGLGLCAVMALGLFKAVVLQSLFLSFSVFSLSLFFCLSLSVSFSLSLSLSFSLSDQQKQQQTCKWAFR